MELGNEINNRARCLYPHGFLIDDHHMGSAVKKTRELINDNSVSVLFEAAFLAGGFAARADIIIRQNHGWRLVEVKSALEDSDRYRNDMAYTAMVLQMAGLPVSGVSLFLISRKFRQGMPEGELFREVEHTADVISQAAFFSHRTKQARHILTSEQQPEPKLLFICRKCSFYGDCIHTVVENPVTDLPRLTESTFSRLIKQGVFRIEEISESFPLSKRQAIARNCVISRQPYIDKNLKQALDRISWPAYYLDFEAITTALPLYPETAPHETIPTQYSIHLCSKPGEITDHREYLADPTRDCKRELAERLVVDLQGTGSIFMYSNYELRIIKMLAGLYPELATELLALKPRLVDLKRILEKNFYHYGFRGRSALKKVLPVLVPGMNYDQLSITNGDTALTVFASMILGGFCDEELATMRHNLLRYCKQDTLSMVKIHERLAEFVNR